MAHKHSNSNKNTKTRESPKSFLLQRKQRVSIADYGNVYIKKTQTQVREMYRSKLGRGRSYSYEPEQPVSSSGTDVKLVRANDEVNALNERIENEIDKLKNFRDCFLQDKQLKEVSQKNSPVAQESPDGSAKRRSRSLHRQRPLPALRTLNSNQEKSKSLVAEKRAKHHERLDAGCSRCMNDNCGTPCSPSYRCAYCPYDPHHCHGEVYQLSNEPHQFVGNSYCYYPSIEPCPQCAEFPVQGCCCHSPQYSHRCRTDLNTDDVCRYMQEPARCSKSPRSRSNSRECKKRNPACRCNQKIMRVTVKKHQQPKPDCASPCDSKPGTSKEQKMIISSYSPCKKKQSDQYCNDTMRMHREYIEMYKKEHEKTAEKLSCQNVQDLVEKRTYIKLPTDPQKDQVKHSSYIKSCGTAQKSVRDLPQRAAAQQTEQQQQEQQQHDWEECLSLYATGRASFNKLNVERKVSGQSSATASRQQERKPCVQTLKIEKDQDQSKKKSSMSDHSSNLRVNVRSCRRDQGQVCQKQREPGPERNLCLNPRSHKKDQQREAEPERNLCLNPRSHKKDQDQVCQKQREAEPERNLCLNPRSHKKNEDQVCQKQREAEPERNLCLNPRSHKKDQDQLRPKYSPSELKKSLRVKVQQFIQNPIQCICPQDPTYNEATVLWNANRSCDTLESERLGGDTPKAEAPKKSVQYKNTCCGPDCPLLLGVPSKISQYSQTTAVASMQTHYVCSRSCREIPTQTDQPETQESSPPVTAASTWSNQMPTNVLHLLQEDFSDAGLPQKCSAMQPDWSSRKIIHKLKRECSDLDVVPCAASKASVKALSKRTSSNTSKQSKCSQRTKKKTCSDPKIPENPTASSTDPLTVIPRFSASELFKEPRNIADESVQKIKIVYSTDLLMMDSKMGIVPSCHSQVSSRTRIPSLPLKTSGQSSDANRSTSPDLEIGYFSPKNVTFDKSVDSVCGSNRSPIDWTQLNTLNLIEDCTMKYDDISEGDNVLNSTGLSTDEFTCQDSSFNDDNDDMCTPCVQRDEDYSTPPPFHGCPCMYKKYLKLAAICYGKK